MRLHGLLSFYDEPIGDLVACLRSLSEAGVDNVIAVDGAYALYPDGKPWSHPDQQAAIVLACRELGMGCTLHVPAGVWEGNEVHKRTFLFALAWANADPGDWFWVMDADQVVTRAPTDLKQQLADTELEAGEVEFLDVVALAANQKDWPPRFTVRNLFAAQPITVQTNHITYVAGDGRLLWGWDGGDRPIEPALDLTDTIEIEHRPNRRPADRQLAKQCYYAQRDEQRVERGACAACGNQSARLVPTGWRMTDIGPVADWTEACETCAQRLEKRSRHELRMIGVDPDSATVENRNGHAPAAVA